MASLTLKHVDRAFPNGYEAVKDLNFRIEDGEFVILTGPIREWKKCCYAHDRRS